MPYEPKPDPTHDHTLWQCEDFAIEYHAHYERPAFEIQFLRRGLLLVMDACELAHFISALRRCSPALAHLHRALVRDCQDYEHADDNATSDRPVVGRITDASKRNGSH